MNLDANGDAPSSSKRRGRKPKEASPDAGESSLEETEDQVMETTDVGDAQVHGDDSLNAQDFVPPNYASLGYMAPELTETR